MTSTQNTANPIEVSIVRESRRSISLHPRPGLLIVKAPLSMSDQHIANFVAQHKDWVAKHCQPQKVRYLVLGQEMDWEADSCQGHPLPKTPSESEKAKIHRRICHAVTQTVFASTVKRLGFERCPLRVCSMASSWGKCHSSGRIELHWRVGTLPEPLAQYVVCHELAHLAHFDHSQAFWAEAGRLDPLARRHDRELNAWRL